MSESNRVLIFCPKFFNYDIEIKKSIEALGYSVELHDERISKSVFTRSLIRLGFNGLLKKNIERYYNNIYQALDERIDYLIVINPECITPAILKKLKRKCNHVVIYMWDSFKNKPQALKLLPFADSFYSFDSQDAKQYNLKFKALFYSTAYSAENNSCVDTSTLDVSFIGTVHSSRYEKVKKITDGFNAFSYFYCPSHFVFFYKKYFTREISNVSLNDVSFTPLNESEVVSVVMKSKCILDIAHPMQQGLTMRTIETIGARKKIITTNKKIIDYDFYEKDNVLIIDRDLSKSQIEQFIHKDYKLLDASIYQKYSINNWVKEFFER